MEITPSFSKSSHHTIEQSFTEEDRQFLPLLESIASKYHIPFEKSQGITPEQLNHTDLERNYTFIHVAVLSGNEELLSYLIKKGADIQQSIQGNLTALHVVTSVRIASILINENANLEAETSDSSMTIRGQTPLFMAVKADNIPLVKMLLKKRPNLLHLAEMQFSLLHFVRSFEMAQILLHAGLKIEELSLRNSFPLERILFNALNQEKKSESMCFVRIALLFLEHGAPVTDIAYELRNELSQKITLSPQDEDFLIWVKLMNRLNTQQHLSDVSAIF